MNREMKILLSLAIVFSFAATSFAYCSDAVSGGEEQTYSILFDMGNGDTEWESISGTGTYDAVISSAAKAAGLEYSSSGSAITISGRTSTTVGSSSDSVTSSWRFYTWDATASAWTEMPFDPSAAYADGNIAVAFYPSGIVPVENPEYRSSWTMVRGDAEQSGSQDATASEKARVEIKWFKTMGNDNYVNATPLVADDKVYIVFGGGYSANNPDPQIICYDRFTGDVIWEYSYPKGAGYETATPLIVGEYIFVPATNGYIYRIPREAGPGESGKDVLVSENIPYHTDTELTGRTYKTAASSLVFDSGCIYFGASNGMVYCMNTDLKILWTYQMNGSVYYTSPTVQDGFVFMGALNGSAYVLDQKNGSLIASDSVYTVTKDTETYGLVSNIVKIGDKLFMSCTDGQGMNTMTGTIAIYTFDGSSMVRESYSFEGFGIPGSYVTPYSGDDFSGIYFIASSDGLCRISADGKFEVINSNITSIKAPMTLVNDDYLLISSYSAGKAIYKTDLSGKVISSYDPPKEASSYCMVAAVVIGDWIYSGNDGGMYAAYGNIVSAAGGSGGIDAWIIAIAVIVGLLLIAGLVCFWYMRKNDLSFSDVRRMISEKMLSNGSGVSYTKRNKRKLIIVLVFGAVLGILLFMLCISCGPSGNMSLGEAFGALISSISKGGHNLTLNELIVYESRLPRAIAAFAVGLGLSVAGAMYQAIIRNPLVDPYIMGVSSGAGTAAIAVIAFNFTFFGLFPVNSMYLTAIAAIVGGLVAFFATMLIAEKSGGTSINYVLAGVVIGLAFSAAQTLMISMSGTKVHDSLTWLFGSFASISWNNVWLTTIPVIALSIIPLFWAKEFNLVLLGEDQAKQMGLDVRKFNRRMLILASIITAFCVAFVGIIGFVGLVIPHLCRMILGGDHRLVLPASMVMGGSLMLLADFAAKMLMMPTELPVGAITTLIGVPVFAYLLIRRGKMYDG